MRTRYLWWIVTASVCVCAALMLLSGAADLPMQGARGEDVSGSSKMVSGGALPEEIQRSQIVPSATPERELRFVGDSGDPLEGVRLRSASNLPSLDINGAVLAVSNEKGVVSCKGVSGNLVATLEGKLSVEVNTQGWIGLRDIMMSSGTSFSVYCVDDQGVPIADCLVALQSPGTYPVLPSLDGSEQDDNPAIEGFRCVRRTDGAGRVAMVVDGDADLQVQVVHRWYITTTPGVLAGMKIDARSGMMLVQMAHARGVIAAPPDGKRVERWAFVVAPKSDRAGYGQAQQVGRRLRDMFPGCGIRVLSEPLRAGVDPEEMTVRAQASDGSLWQCMTTPQQLSPDTIPVRMTPVAEGVGWLRIDVLGQGVNLDGMLLQLGSATGGDWWCLSGHSVQLPVGEYRIYPPNVPGLDEICDNIVAVVRGGSQASEAVVVVAMPVAVGRVDVVVDIAHDVEESMLSMRVELAGGDSFCINDTSATTFALPVGRHKLQITAVGYEPQAYNVMVEANQTTVFHCTLTALQ